MTDTDARVTKAMKFIREGSVMRKLFAVILLALFGGTGFAQEEDFMGIMSPLECMQLELELFNGEIFGGECIWFESPVHELRTNTMLAMFRDGHSLQEEDVMEGFAVQMWTHRHKGLNMTVQIYESDNLSYLILYNHEWFTGQ